MKIYALIYFVACCPGVRRRRTHTVCVSWRRGASRDVGGSTLLPFCALQSQSPATLRPASIQRALPGVVVFSGHAFSLGTAHGARAYGLNGMSQGRSPCHPMYRRLTALRRGCITSRPPTPSLLSATTVTRQLRQNLRSDLRKYSGSFLAPFYTFYYRLFDRNHLVDTLACPSAHRYPAPRSPPRPQP